MATKAQESVNELFALSPNSGPPPVRYALPKWLVEAVIATEWSQPTPARAKKRAKSSH